MEWGHYAKDQNPTKAVSNEHNWAILESTENKQLANTVENGNNYRAIDLRVFKLLNETSPIIGEVCSSWVLKIAVIAIGHDTDMLGMQRQKVVQPHRMGLSASPRPIGMTSKAGNGDDA